MHSGCLSLLCFMTILFFFFFEEEKKRGDGIMSLFDLRSSNFAAVGQGLGFRGINRPMQEIRFY